MITREQYMADSEALHDAYYLEIATVAGVKFTNAAEIQQFRKALETDPHMNNIPLSSWDGKAYAMMLHNGLNIHNALKARGDFYSLSVGVCILKAAARHAAKQRG